MTVANNYAPVVAAANGSTTVFSGSWNAITASYLVVQLLNTTTGVYTTISQGAGGGQYQVTSLGSSGFVITFNTAPASGNDVVISRATPPAQGIPYTTSRGFQGSVEEGSFDILTTMVQELDYTLSSAIQAPVGDTVTDLTLPIASLRANFLLGFDASGNVTVSTLTVSQMQTAAAAAAASATASASSATASANSAAAAAASAVGAGNSQTSAATSAATATTEAGIATTQATAAAASAVNAAASAAMAAGSLIGTSTTSNTIANTGSITFTTQTGLDLVVGGFVVAASTLSPSNYIYGQTTAYNSGTGVYTMAASRDGGSGTYNAWTLSVSGPAGIGTGDASTNTSSSTTNDIATFADTSGKLLKDSGIKFGTGANNAVQLDGSSRLPAVDGSQLTNLPGGVTAPTVLTSSGNYTTSPNVTAATLFKVTLIGPGGGGGGNANATGSGGGGGAGATCILWTTGLAASTAYAYAQGSIGTGAASGSNDGTDATASTFVMGSTTMTANGGKKGVHLGLGGLGGTATSGTLNIPGGNGGSGSTFNNNAPGGTGGNTILGFGGTSQSSADALAGVGFGSGGGGGFDNGAHAGGNGAPGILIVERLSG